MFGCEFSLQPLLHIIVVIVARSKRFNMVKERERERKGYDQTRTINPAKPLSYVQVQEVPAQVPSPLANGLIRGDLCRFRADNA